MEDVAGFLIPPLVPPCRPYSENPDFWFLASRISKPIFNPNDQQRGCNKSSLCEEICAFQLAAGKVAGSCFLSSLHLYYWIREVGSYVYALVIL